jgi:hypothetical protein
MDKRITLIVVGSRDFDDYVYMHSRLDALTAKFVNGIDLFTGANYTEKDGEHWPRAWSPEEQGWVRTGADWGAKVWAENNALKRGVVLHLFHAEWDDYGKAAGPVRNSKMLKAAGPESYLVAFWDGSSPGTQDAINKAKRLLKPNRIKIEEVW